MIGKCPLMIAKKIKEDNSGIKKLPGTTQDPEITTLPYKPEQDNGFTKFPRIIDGEVDTNEPSGNRVKMLSNRSDIQPVRLSYRNPDKITEIEHDMNEILHADRDYVIETYAPKYGVEYDGGYMSDKYKEQIIKDIYASAEYEYISANKPRPESVITEELTNIIKNVELLVVPAEKTMTEIYNRQQDINRAMMDPNYMDTFLEKYQDIYGYDYNDNMSEAQKKELFSNLKTNIENEHNKAHNISKSTGNAIDSINWINENINKKPKDSYDARKICDEVLDFQGNAWFMYLLTDTKEAEALTKMWDVASEKAASNLYYSETTARNVLRYCGDVFVKEVFGAIVDKVAKPVGVLLNVIELDEETKRYVGFAYKSMIEAGISKEIASIKAREKGVIEATKNAIISFRM